MYGYDDLGREIELSYYGIEGELIEVLILKAAVSVQN